MIPPFQADPVPLREDGRGGFRVGESRVPVDVVLDEYENGADPESIVNAYPTLRLADVYAVIAYYLQHREEVSVYLRDREVKAAELRREIESRQSGRAELRATLLRGAANGRTAMLPLAADESLHGHIVRGLRRREPNIDLVLVEEAGLRGSTDTVVLEWAAQEERVLVTQDEQTMIGFAWDRVKAGSRMPGLVVRGKGISIRQAIEDLLLIASCGLAEDFKDQVKHLPL